MNKLSICVFIKDNNEGAFGLWESMAQLMPLADEFFVLDLGSTDGTYEILKDLATKNSKLRVEQGTFPINPVTGLIDAGSFAEIPNAMIPTCKNDLVMCYQADEIYHEDLLKLLVKRLETPIEKGLSFWRYQLRDNFQKIKWFPHIVHRINQKDNFVFVEDGMNTNRFMDAELLSNYDGGWFIRWGSEYSKSRTYKVDNNGNAYIYGRLQKTINEGKEAFTMPTNEMIMDISSIGGFLENITAKAKKHAPLWRTSDTSINIDGISHNLNDWYNVQLNNNDWNKTDTPFNIPEIIKPLLGVKKYPVRQEILNKIANS